MGNSKKYLIASLWFICGNLIWLSANYLLNPVTSHLIPLTSRFLESTFHLSLGPGHVAFLLLTGSKLVIIFPVAFLIGRVAEMWKLQFFAFTIGVMGVPLYQTIYYNIAALNYYGISPLMLLREPLVKGLVESIATDLIIIPLVVWVGMYSGNEYRLRKTA